MREQASVRKIESFFANCKKILLKVKFQKMIYHLRNMCGNVLDLPDHVLVKILEYLTFQERFQNHQLSTKMRFCLKQPYLFKSLKINNNSMLFQSPIVNEHFMNFISMANQLQVISLKYCPNFSKDVLNIINMNCNPFSLNELYLDGCEGVGDCTFDCLMLSKEEQQLLRQSNGEPLIEESKSNAVAQVSQVILNSLGIQLNNSSVLAGSSQNPEFTNIQIPANTDYLAIAVNGSLLSNQANISQPDSQEQQKVDESNKDKDSSEPQIQKNEKIIIELSEQQQALQDKHLNQNNIDTFLSRQTSEILESIHAQSNLPSNLGTDEITEEDQIDSGSKEKTKSEVFKHLSRGGLRGLTVLSLAECRNLSDVGLAKLNQLKYLKRLSLLWCTKIEDEGLKSITKQFEFIQDLDLGGTSITSSGLREMVQNAKYLEKVSIMGCKKLNNSDDQILIKKNIQCQGVDDVFRFHLLPELTSSDLPQITKSVLKTRSTLGLNKVYKYLFRRLLSLKIEDLVRDPNDPTEVLTDTNIEMIVPEEKIEILCNGHYLKATLQLKEVKELFWQGPFTNPNYDPNLLILQYRRKFSKTENLAISFDDQYTKRKDYHQRLGATGLAEFLQ